MRRPLAILLMLTVLFTREPAIEPIMDFEDDKKYTVGGEQFIV